MQLHTKGVRSMSHASGSMSSTGKALKMTISMNAGFRFAGETVSPTFPVIERIKTEFEVNDYHAQEYYNYCMRKFAMNPNKYKKMRGEDLMRQCIEFISTLHTANSDDENLPAPGRMYKQYHVNYGNHNHNQERYQKIEGLQI